MSNTSLDLTLDPALTEVSHDSLNNLIEKGIKPEIVESLSNFIESSSLENKEDIIQAINEKATQVDIKFFEFFNEQEGSPEVKAQMLFTFLVMDHKAPINMGWTRIYQHLSRNNLGHSEWRNPFNNETIRIKEDGKITKNPYAGKFIYIQDGMMDDYGSSNPLVYTIDEAREKLRTNQMVVTRLSGKDVRQQNEKPHELTKPKRRTFFNRQTLKAGTVKPSIPVEEQNIYYISFSDKTIRDEDGDQRSMQQGRTSATIAMDKRFGPECVDPLDEISEETKKKLAKIFLHYTA